MKKKFSKKLSLNKRTIASLNPDEMDQVRGGDFRADARTAAVQALIFFVRLGTEASQISRQTAIHMTANYTVLVRLGY